MEKFAKTTQRWKRQITGRSSLGVSGYLAAVVGGALLGGVALALLNRKTLQELRDKLDERPTYSPDEIY